MVASAATAMWRCGRYNARDVKLWWLGQGGGRKRAGLVW